MNSGTGEIMLFGVRVVVDSMRKSVSMNNLSQYELPPSHDASPAANLNNSVPDVAAGYASADDAVVLQSSVAGRERKRGVPWTEDEHKLFLLGLQKVGKGDWRGISRNFVKTRTPTQVASHAQKYFLRRSNLNRRRRRSSLFDITTDSVNPIPAVEEAPENRVLDQAAPTTHSLQLESCNNACGIAVVPACSVPMGSLVLPVGIENSVAGNNCQSVKMVYPIQVHSPGLSSGTGLNLDLNSAAELSPVSLQLSLSSDQSQMSGHSSFQLMSFSHGDSMIRVA